MLTAWLDGMTDAARTPVGGTYMYSVFIMLIAGAFFLVALGMIHTNWTELEDRREKGEHITQAMVFQALSVWSALGISSAISILLGWIGLALSVLLSIPYFIIFVGVAMRSADPKSKNTALADPRKIDA